MPHFILDCTEPILEQKEPKLIMQEVLDTAFSTGLFVKSDIKVRLNPYPLKHSLVLEGDADFIHVFGNIMQGRTDEQKADLSKRIVKRLKEMFPDVPIISINIRDFEKASYCKKDMV
ncbi:5-carboxymethyl-2-hydroxymuconate Delta-isomerase [Pseudotenacibaculum sp. MALMAid0570]|uniref:5-carboxymethyl-2-hydroxymuconate Delta-isomerase n=1 Tax=Pseudotenacibaculum sp. MALMAid0570 TaxID=3143938 RepID=UPI0032E00D5B